MHILLIHTYFLPSNAPGSVRWNETARIWAEAGHTITVIAGNLDYTTGRPYSQLTEFDQPGIQVIRVSVPASYTRGQLGRLWAYAYLFVSSLMAGFRLTGRRVDLVIASSPPLTIGLAGWLLARWHQIPLLLEIRDLWPDAPIEMGFLQSSLFKRLAFWLEEFLYQRAHQIVVLTSAFKDVLTDNKSVVADKIAVIPNGADIVMTDALYQSVNQQAFRREHGMADGFWIVYAGAHGPANGLDVILQAANKLRDTDIHFLLIGDGPVKKALQAEAFGLRLTNVRFEDSNQKQQVLRFILAADAGLVIMQPLPVFNAMLSAKLFDYLACRKPVFTAISGLSNDLIINSKSGLYLNYSTPDDWKQTLSVYSQNAELARQHGQNGYQMVKQTFNRQSLAADYLTLIQQSCLLHKLGH